MRTKQKQLERIVKEYQLAGNEWPAKSRTIAKWAIKTGRWKAHPMAAERRCAREIGRALREEYHTDSDGRRVRTKHAVRKRNERGQYEIVWDDIRTAPRVHMEASFQQRRERIVGDCRQLKTDVDSYNDARPDDRPIQISLDFTKDVEELEALRKANAA